MSPVERLTFEATDHPEGATPWCGFRRPGTMITSASSLPRSLGEAACFSARACLLDLNGGDPDLSGLSPRGRWVQFEDPPCPSLCGPGPMGTVLAPVRSSFPSLSATAVQALWTTFRFSRCVNVGSALGRPVPKVLTLITWHTQLVCTVRDEDPETANSGV